MGKRRQTFSEFSALILVIFRSFEDPPPITTSRYIYLVLTNQVDCASIGSGSGGFGVRISSGGKTRAELARTFLWATAKLTLILAYFYVCDRTNFFMKENK